MSVQLFLLLPPVLQPLYGQCTGAFQTGGAVSDGEASSSTVGEQSLAGAKSTNATPASLSVNDAIGVSIGGIVIVALITVAVFIVVRRRRPVQRNHVMLRFPLSDDSEALPPLSAVASAVDTGEAFSDI